MAEQKRQDVRIDYSADFTCRQLILPDGRIIDLKKPIFGVTENISAGGALLIVQLDIPESVGLMLLLPQTGVGQPVASTIIRKTQSGENFKYGCRFSIPDNAREQLRKFVFEIQRENLRKTSLSRK